MKRKTRKDINEDRNEENEQNYGWRDKKSQRKFTNGKALNKNRN